MLAAVVGGGAVLALGALGAAGHDQSSPPAAAHAKMNLGQTSTETKPASVPATSMAQPSLKGPAPLPSEEEDAK